MNKDKMMPEMEKTGLDGNTLESSYERPKLVRHGKAAQMTLQAGEGFSEFPPGNPDFPPPFSD